MVLLIDTNVVLDVLQERMDFYDASSRIMKICANKKARGYSQGDHARGIFEASFQSNIETARKQAEAFVSAFSFLS